MNARGRPIVGPVPGMTLSESVARLGACAWVEQRLFETLGGWVRSTSDPALALALATVARHHASHALQIAGLLPATRDHDPAVLVTPPPDDDDHHWASVARAEEPTAGLATILGSALSGHLAALESWLEGASPVRDGPGIRVVEAVLAEDRTDRDRLSGFVG